jgi:AcrR family transcriptional regulator
MRDYGLGATVEEIAEDAGVSVANFYNYYTSRNALAVDAFTTLVVYPLEQAATDRLPFDESVMAVNRLCESRTALVRAALLGRLEYEPSIPDVTAPLKVVKGFLGSVIVAPFGVDFVYRLAKLLADDKILAEGYDEANVLLVLPMAVLHLLDSIALGDHLVDPLTLARATLKACRGD